MLYFETNSAGRGTRAVRRFRATGSDERRAQLALSGTDARRRVYLVRHAEVDYFDASGNPFDPRRVALTDNGREQARALGAILRDIPFDRVFCSGLPRTEETAALVLGDVPTPIETEPDLQEVRGGRLREMDRTALERRIAYAFDRAGELDAAFIGGERFADFERRVLTGWRRVLAARDWEQMLIVAHEGVNRTLLAWASGGTREHMMRFDQDAACYNIIDLDIVEGEISRTVIKAHNVTPYNPAKKDMHLSNMEQVFRTYMHMRPDEDPGT